MASTTPCCRCNRASTCRNCKCAKSGNNCTNCLPQRLNKCKNDDAAVQNSFRGNIQVSQTTPSNIVNNVIDHAEQFDTILDGNDIIHANNGIENIQDHTQHHAGITNVIKDLPQYNMLPPPPYGLTWGNTDCETMAHSVECTYGEIVHWRRNLFNIPSGKNGNAFVNEIANLFTSYAENSGYASFAIKAAMVLPALVLQKPHSKSKTKEHNIHLERRLQLWKNGDINSLVLEGRQIQKQLKNNRRHINVNNEGQLANTFAKLIMAGKLKAALRLLSLEDNGGALPLSRDVLDALHAKHPPKTPPEHDALVTDNVQAREPHFILYEPIDGDLIRETALKTHGSAGPSGLDSAAWRRMCTSFRSASTNLCAAVAATARKMCTSYIDPNGISALVACRLIALDKCPGVRPIGIGETVRRIIGRAILKLIRDDIQSIAGSEQLCAGQDSGCEAAIHATRQIFQSPDTEGILLVDATNAFNSLNRQTALRNIHQLCPSLATFLTNTYREDICLFIDNATIMSEEGTTQGDPLAMAMYALGIIPLIKSIKDANVNQIWYADDATACAKLRDLRTWWDKLVALGPKYGYFPNPAKTWLVVKEDKLEEANIIFHNTGVKFTTHGKRHLGACIGRQAFVTSYIQEKVNKWVQEVERLSAYAITQPQAAYAAFSHGLSNKWKFVSRTVPGIADLLTPLELVIRNQFIPSLTGQTSLSDEMRDLMAMPVRLGGMGIINPAKQSTRDYKASQKITGPLVALIVLQTETNNNYTDIRSEQKKCKMQSQRLRKELEIEQSKIIINALPEDTKRALYVSNEKGASSWLNTLPIEEHGFSLHKGAFRDALCLRYGWRPKDLPEKCLCGKLFSVEHALSCPTGGFPIIRHNEIRDLTAHLMTEVCHGVSTEPALQPVTDEHLHYRSANRDDHARLDISATSFWGNDRQRAFFDVRVFNPYARTYCNTTLEQCHLKNENAKNREYEERIREIERASFTPLTFSAAGGLGPAADKVYKRLAYLLSEKNNKSYSMTIHWLRCKLSFSLLRSAIMCLRGARSSLYKPIRMNICDGIELAFNEGGLRH